MADLVKGYIIGVSNENIIIVTPDRQRFSKPVEEWAQLAAEHEDRIRGYID